MLLLVRLGLNYQQLPNFTVGEYPGWFIRSGVHRITLIILKFLRSTGIYHDLDDAAPTNRNCFKYISSS